LQAVVEDENWCLFKHLMQFDPMKSLIGVQSYKERHERNRLVRKGSVSVFGILAGQGNTSILKKILSDYSIDHNSLSYNDIQVMLGYAIAKGQIDMLDYLTNELKYSFDVKDGFYVSSRGTPLFSPLVEAALNGYDAMVIKVLLNSKPS
jgi:hypothetical protein